MLQKCKTYLYTLIVDNVLRSSEIFMLRLQTRFLCSIYPSMLLVIILFIRDVIYFQYFITMSREIRTLRIFINKKFFDRIQNKRYYIHFKLVRLSNIRRTSDKYINIHEIIHLFYIINTTNRMYCIMNKIFSPCDNVITLRIEHNFLLIL